MSLIDASEDSTPSTAPMETLVVFEDSALEMRSARMPLSASAARGGAPATISATIAAANVAHRMRRRNGAIRKPARC